MSLFSLLFLLTHLQEPGQIKKLMDSLYALISYDNMNHTATKQDKPGMRGSGRFAEQRETTEFKKRSRLSLLRQAGRKRKIPEI